MLLGKTQISAISGTRRIRVLIASGNPERIMLVRESLHAWPETVVCRVAVSREDAVTQFESHAPHVVCWDTGLGTDVPAAGIVAGLLYAFNPIRVGINITRPSVWDSAWLGFALFSPHILIATTSKLD